MEKDLWQQHKSEITAKIKFFCHPPRLVLSWWGVRVFCTETLIQNRYRLGAESLNPAISFYKSLRLTRPFGDFPSRAMPAILGRDAAFRPHCGYESAGSWKIPVTTSMLYDHSGRVKFCRLPRWGYREIAPGKSMRLVYRRERNLYETIFLSTRMNRLATRASLGEDSQSCLQFCGSAIDTNYYAACKRVQVFANKWYLRCTMTRELSFNFRVINLLLNNNNFEIILLFAHNVLN